MRVSRLKVRARILKRGKKKKESKKRGVGIQSKIRELADKYERVLVENANERRIYKFQPQINTDRLFIRVHLW